MATEGINRFKSKALRRFQLLTSFVLSVYSGWNTRYFAPIVKLLKPEVEILLKASLSLWYVN